MIRHYEITIMKSLDGGRTNGRGTSRWCARQIAEQAKRQIELMLQPYLGCNIVMLHIYL
jgi:hypothetical protein